MKHLLTILLCLIAISCSKKVVTKTITVEKEIPVEVEVIKEVTKEIEVCPEEIPNKIDIDETIYFNFDSHTLTDKAIMALNAIKIKLQTYFDTKVILEGSACPIGEEGYNKILSTKRAQEVYKFLDLGEGNMATGLGECDGSTEYKYCRNVRIKSL